MSFVKNFTYILCLFIVIPIHAQIKLFPLKQPINIQARTNHHAAASNLATGTLPFWDDFSISEGMLDSIRIWENDTMPQWDYQLSKNVIISSTLAIHPPTLNTATFDGWDFSGQVYSEDQDAIGLTDQLVSCVIDLDGFLLQDSIYISFFWQAGGNVEIPDFKTDSLRLQFLNKDSVWKTVWKKEGDETLDKTKFRQEIILVNEVFLSNKFRFQFQSFGDQDGPFDAWHLDWIYLNKNRRKSDTAYIDRAISGKFKGFFHPYVYQAMPISQIKANPNLMFQQEVNLSNLDVVRQAANIINIIRDGPTQTNILFPSQPFTLGDTIVVNSGLGLPADSTITIQLPPVDPKSLIQNDSIFVVSEVHIPEGGDGLLGNTSIDLQINDTGRTSFLFHDYYAYDDGTAEYVAATNLKGHVAIQFWVETPDTITHIDILFPNIDPISENAQLNLRIFSKLTAEDDQILYEQPIFVTNSTDVNAFTRYPLTIPLTVTDTFFVGYQQLVDEYVGIGFDRSNPDAAAYIYEKNFENGEWIQNNILEGALMIRPIFGELVDSLLITQVESQKEPTIKKESVFFFPNPNEGSIKVNQDYLYIIMFDLTGKVIFRENKRKTHDIFTYHKGVYFIKIVTKTSEYIQKIILK